MTSLADAPPEETDEVDEARGFIVLPIPVSAREIAKALVAGESRAAFFPKNARFPCALRRMRTAARRGPIFQLFWTSDVARNLERAIREGGWRHFPCLSKSQFVRDPLRWCRVLIEEDLSVLSALPCVPCLPTPDGMTRPDPIDLRAWLLRVGRTRRTKETKRANEIVSGLSEENAARPPVLLLANVQGVFDIDGDGLLGTFLCQ